MNAQPTALDFLLADLDTALADAKAAARVTRLLESYAAARSEDWRRFALFDASSYSRNLVRRSDLYELIVLCWSQGQRSPIHDHAGQRCWMAVLDGAVRESMFIPDPAGGRLREGAVREFGPGRVAFITDEAGWHRIEPSAGRSAVTLHLYSRPIGACRIYDEAREAVVERSMRYHSIGGLLQPVGA